jgi:hypothetical protein
MRWALAASAGLVAPALCAPAAYAGTHVTATGQVVFDYDDNISAAPADAGPIAAFGLEVSPGIALYHDDPRERFVLRYSHPVQFYFGHMEQSSDADVASAIGLFHLTALDDLLLDLELRRQSTALFALAAPQQTTIEARVTGDQPLVPISLSEMLRHDFSPSWSLEQDADAGVTIPIGSNSTQQLIFNGGVSLAPEVVTGSHSFALVPAFRYTHGEPAAAAGGAPNSQERSDQLLPSAALRWRWDWTQEWSSEARAGVAVPYLVHHGVAAAPIGAAAVHWDETGYGLSLEYARDFRPDSITGQTYYSDTIQLTGSVPLWPSLDLRAAASTGFAWNRLSALGPTQIVERADTWVADVGVGWYPRALAPSIALRYQHVQQLAAPAGQTLLFDFSRNVISLTLGYQYPVVRETPISRHLPGRVDRADSSDAEPEPPNPKP